jgi:hypothetical protein
VKIEVAPDYHKNEIVDLINCFDEKGETFYAKRNTIKIFKAGEEEWNVKSFKIPHVFNKIVYKFFRKSKAQRSFAYANYLLAHDILTPKPIAYIEKQTILGLSNSFYISENLHYDITFRELINDKNYPDRENILQQFTEFTFKLHEKGIHFLDHSPGNTLIVAKENKQYDFYLIDLNRMNFGHMDFETRIQNFAKLSLTPDMIVIISKKYASLISKEYALVHGAITRVCEESAMRRERKKALKKKIGL